MRTNGINDGNFERITDNESIDNKIHVRIFIGTETDINWGKNEAKTV